MNGNIIWKIILTALLLTWAVASFTPVQDTPFETYIRSEVTENKDGFEALLKEAKSAMDKDVSKNPTLYVALANIVKEAEVDLSSFFPHINVQDIKNLNKRNDILLSELLKRSQGKVRLGLDLKGGVAFTFKVDENDLSKDQRQRAEQLNQARSIIQQRVDGLGVAEPVIRLKGSNRIEVQMPGVSTRDNPTAVDSISAPALLEFCLVHRTANPRTMAEPPLGYVKKFQEIEDPETGEIRQIPYFVKRIPEMTGEIIKEAYASPNQFGGFRVILQFTDEGAKQFARVTRKIAEENTANSIGQLAIILDGKLYSAPSVQKEIIGGAEITGRFSQREAIELANVLNNPLQVGLKIDEMYEVGPTLAAESRDASLEAGMWGGGLVLIFMIIYYMMFGVIAMLTVGMNILLVIGALASFHATITLPGVAALVLTIGMAVDANILIFERIREELKIGKSLSTALDAGFEKAFSTIVDANVTTFITAFILYALGTGPVKGFGITLMVGIGATLFCSLVASRWMLELLIHLKIIRSAMRFELLGATNIQFLSMARKAFAGSWTIVIVGVVFLVLNWGNIFGIDFKGGDEITLGYERRLEPSDITSVSSAPFVASDGVTYEFNEVNPIYQSLIGQDKEIIKIQTDLGKGGPLFEALNTAYPDYGLNLLGKSRIGAAVGGDVTKSAIMSIGFSLFAILLYVAIRFEFGYALGAIVASIHDILMTVGLFVVLGAFGMGSGQFTSPMIAAILMTVGYSINDTIVVFDRIREELELNPGVDLKQIVHLSINSVLSRTLLTSITTLLATLALYLFAAGVIVDLALVFLIGIITGTFSSIFIASPIFYWYHKGNRAHVEEGHIIPSYDWHTDQK